MLAWTAVIAHEGGWDEIMLVAVPIVVIVAILAIAKRRVDNESAERARPPND